VGVLVGKTELRGKNRAWAHPEKTEEDEKKNTTVMKGKRVMGRTAKNAARPIRFPPNP